MGQCSKCAFRSPDGEDCCWVEEATYRIAKQPPWLRIVPIKDANPLNDCEAFMAGPAYSGKIEDQPHPTPPSAASDEEE